MPAGWKNLCDDPYHSDWLIGAGFTNPDAMNDNKFINTDTRKLAAAQALSKIADTLKTDIQNQFLGAGATLLSGAGRSFGKIEFAKPNQPVENGSIAVIPNAGPDYLQAAISAAAVITERGGEMAHLANIGRERNILIVRIDNARKRFLPGMMVEVDGEQRTVTIDIEPDWNDDMAMNVVVMEFDDCTETVDLFQIDEGEVDTMCDILTKAMESIVVTPTVCVCPGPG